MANYPGTQNTDDNLYLAVNNLSTVLTDDPLAAGATTVNVSDASNFPSVGILTIDLEAIHYTGKTATSFTGCTRGFDGTTDVQHDVGATVFHDIPAAHHNVLKDEIKAVTDDLRDLFTADLNDAVTPAVTATDAKERLDHLVTQLKEITGETDWKTAPATTLSLIDSVKSALDDADTPAATATDIKDRLDQIVSQLKAITGETNWYDTPDNTIAALETDKAEDSAVVHLTGAETIGGIKTFSDQADFDSGLQTGSTIISDTDNTDDLGSDSIAFKDLYLKGDVKVGSTTAIDLAGSGAVSIRGSNTNDSAAAGYVGEIIESYASATNFPATSTYGDLTSISLTAGDWLVSIVGYANFPAAITEVRVGISSNSGNSATGLVAGDNFASPRRTYSANDREALAINSFHVQLSGSTTYYYKYYAQYASTAPTLAGRITAQRIR